MPLMHWWLHQLQASARLVLQSALAPAVRMSETMQLGVQGTAGACEAGSNLLQAPGRRVGEAQLGIPNIKQLHILGNHKEPLSLETGCQRQDQRLQLRCCVVGTRVGLTVAAAAHLASTRLALLASMFRMPHSRATAALQQCQAQGCGSGGYTSDWACQSPSSGIGAIKACASAKGVGR